ncbi:MAG: hypothetical protein JWO66_503 [Candidatus Eremiobacteraeota bacterium]|nr:hypothetical protein [Candidatus Eremiobacteraeota bacterium]
MSSTMSAAWSIFVGVVLVILTLTLPGSWTVLKSALILLVILGLAVNTIALVVSRRRAKERH